MVMEAFACRCPVVTTEAVPYAIADENALVSKVGDVSSLAEQCCTLLNSDILAQSLVSKGYEYAMTHSLADSLTKFERSINLMAKG